MVLSTRISAGYYPTLLDIDMIMGYDLKKGKSSNSNHLCSDKSTIFGIPYFEKHPYINHLLHRKSFTPAATFVIVVWSRPTASCERHRSTLELQSVTDE